MALHPKNGEKLIFAPTGTPSSSSPAPQSAALPGPPAPSASAPQFLKNSGLHRSDLDPANPVAQFHAWFTTASDPAAGVGHPETCTLSTAALPSGRVSARMVYLKELDAQGFVVYSNFGTSGKARDLFGIPPADDRQPNPWAALTFWWESQERQVRVEGRAHRLSAAESQTYYDTRVRGSRIGAWASRQSMAVRPDPDVPNDDGRAQLDRWVAEVEERFKDQEQIPVPEFWGGLRIVPERIEFWQGRENRLHDRFVYDRVEGEDGGWVLERLSP
ncbi:pyridoxamine 5'-phosphate oxidase [Thozetella sp. PMI_491]|nr:pyridoxamine 5'-phosphate oxidase [Thozetella sp. PMI_491]